MKRIKRLLNAAVLMVLAFVLLLAGDASAITASDVEAAVEADLGIGATTTYLDFTNSSIGDTREGFAISQSASGDNWGYPDTSNTVMMVNADSLDDKFNTASDFEITITGLDANTDYGVYYCVKGRPTNSATGDFSWGYESDGAAIYDISTISDQIGAVQLAGDISSGDYMYAVPLPGAFTSDEFGTLKMWVGCATLYNTTDNEFVRTQLDGVVIAPPPKNAWTPSPADGAVNVDLESDLSWLAGGDAISHDVYFGTDEAAVTNALRLAGDINGDGPVNIDDLKMLASLWVTDADFEDFSMLAADWGLTADAEFKGNQTGTTYDPGILLDNTTYYWRIDEVNPSEVDSPWTGDVWSFTTESPLAPAGTIIVDPDNPARMVYSQTYENGLLKPVCFAGPGDPEDFFYNDTANNLSLLTSRPARCTYITAVLKDFGGGNPGTGAALDAKLDEWEGYITQLENAGIITVFFFFDDSAGLNDVSDWQELVDKCVAKFKHHKLLIWSVAEEYAEALSSSQVSTVAARIKLQDTNNHVVGVHKNAGTSFSEFLSDPNIDMFLMQTNSTTASGIHSDVKNSNANGSKIINMAEAPDHAKQTQTIVRQWNWAAIMGGASAAQVLWMGRYSDPVDWNAQGKYDDCARLMDFMESTRINETTCRDDLVSGSTDYVLANPGNVYIAYGDSVSTSLGLNMVAGDYIVQWFDPIDGDWVDLGTQTVSSGIQSFTKPAAIGSEAVLYLEMNDGWSYGVETENYDTELGNGWSLQTATSGYDGSGYMQADASGGTLQYQISFPSAGTYYCYIRNWASGSENNGCHLELDGTRISEINGREAVYATKESKWNWATQWQLGEGAHIGPLDIVINTAGPHTLGIVTRDLGFKVDRVIVIDRKIGDQDYTGTTAPAFLDVLETVPNGYN
jgi:hypothetical protein